MSKIVLGEKIFRSIQGEGDLTGRLSIWIRFGGCNLKCPGFFQKDPTDQTTWIKPLALSPKEYKHLDELPVIPVGCDSLYSIDPKFKHLWTTYPSAKELVEDINKLLYDRQWSHPITNNMIDLCFTGGEPMLQQKAMVEIMKEIRVEEKGLTVQIETNGTKPLQLVFKEYIRDNFNLATLHFNISPKLHHVSGEKDAVIYKNIFDYQELGHGILKFVVNNDDRTWEELNMHIKNLRDEGVLYPIYIMPVGATKEQQEDSKVISAIANKAIDNGYHISGRLHAILFGNGIGT